MSELLPDSPTIPLTEVAKIPVPGMAFPANLAFSPDDCIISYLYSPERSLTRQLFAFDPQGEPQSGQHSLLTAAPGGGTTEENVSLEEALRRERMRQLEIGVTHYAWSGQRLLIPARPVCC
jgi:dipeptidyl-peptidase 4